MATQVLVAAPARQGTVNMRPATVLICLLGLAIFSSARAAAPPIAQAEISYLLESVENSGCEFYRNGTWYDSKKARAHLQSKFEMLSAAGRINSAEDFIESAGTRSSLSGLPYQVRCGGEPIMSSQWLRSELEHYRSHGTPRESRGVPAPVQG